MTAATTTRPEHGDVPQRQVHWRELAALVDATGTRPGYSQAAGRAYLEIGGVLTWADCSAVTLDMDVPGASQIQDARCDGFFESERLLEAAALAALSPEQRELRLAEQRRVRDLPDPPTWWVLDRLEDGRWAW